MPRKWTVVVIFYILVFTKHLVFTLKACTVISLLHFSNFMVPKPLPGQSVSQFIHQKLIGLVVCGFLWSPNLCLVNCKSVKFLTEPLPGQSVNQLMTASTIYRFCGSWLFMVTKPLPGQFVSQFMQQKFICFVLGDFLWSPNHYLVNL